MRRRLRDKPNSSCGVVERELKDKVEDLVFLLEIISELPLHPFPPHMEIVWCPFHR